MLWSQLGKGALMFMNILLPFSAVAWFLADCVWHSHLSHQCPCHPGILCIDGYFWTQSVPEQRCLQLSREGTPVREGKIWTADSVGKTVEMEVEESSTMQADNGAESMWETWSWWSEAWLCNCLSSLVFSSACSCLNPMLKPLWGVCVHNKCISVQHQKCHS